MRGHSRQPAMAQSARSVLCARPLAFHSLHHSSSRPSASSEAATTMVTNAHAAPPSRGRVTSAPLAVANAVLSADFAGHFRCKYNGLRRVGHLLRPVLILEGSSGTRPTYPTAPPPPLLSSTGSDRLPTAEPTTGRLLHRYDAACCQRRICDAVGDIHSPHRHRQ